MDWSDIRKEMVDEKGISPEAADQIGEYVMLRGGMELVERLKADPKLMAVKDAQEGVEGMALMLRYCELFGVQDKASVCHVHCRQCKKLSGSVKRIGEDEFTFLFAAGIV